MDPEDCVDNVTLEASDVILNLPPGMVCIECVFGGVVANDTEFQIDNSDIDASVGRVVDGVLVVFDTTNVFDVKSTEIHCTSAAASDQISAIVLLESKSSLHGSIVIIRLHACSENFCFIFSLQSSSNHRRDSHQ